MHRKTGVHSNCKSTLMHSYSHFFGSLSCFGFADATIISLFVVHMDYNKKGLPFETLANDYCLGY
jgi:hypothetical protein